MAKAQLAYDEPKVRESGFFPSKGRAPEAPPVAMEEVDGARQLAPGLFLTPIVNDLKKRGFDERALSESFGLPQGAAFGPGEGVSAALLAKIWRELPRITGDVNYGLHLGQHAPLGEYSVLDYLSRSCSTVDEALRRVTHVFAGLTCLSRTAEYVSGPTESALRQWVMDRTELRHAWEALFSRIVCVLRSATRPDFRPKAVRFVHRRPADLREHERIFGCPIEFDAPYNELVLSRECREETLRTSDSRLAALLHTYVVSTLPTSPRRLSDTVASVLRNNFAQATLPLVAAKLGTTPRTLQRRLVEEGTTFGQVFEATRRALATDYLRDSKRTITFIAIELGFRSTSAFTRAFRRWMKTSPSAFRSLAKRSATVR